MPAKCPGSERRRHARVRELYLLTYLNREGGEQKTPVSMGRTLDISRSGVRLEIGEQVSPGSRMEMEIAIRNTSLIVRGRVIHATEVAKGRYAVGVEFDSLCEEAAIGP